MCVSKGFLILIKDKINLCVCFEWCNFVGLFDLSFEQSIVFVKMRQNAHFETPFPIIVGHFMNKILQDYIKLGHVLFQNIVASSSWLS